MEELLKQKFNSDSEDEEYIPTKKELEESNEDKKKEQKRPKSNKIKGGRLKRLPFCMF